MGSCAAPSAKGDDKFITTDYLQQCLKKLSVILVSRKVLISTIIIQEETNIADCEQFLHFPIYIFSDLR
uniref:Uncharacterized protein n=1 Tax=Escherichia coli TaxID=562 RepID=A0A2P9E608_ECOLX|nr:hypothetical protein [Escherichia coli]SPD98810.1 Hypothetical protein RCS46_P0236 [Escherichia coli]